MFPGIGTLINVVTIISGASIGVLVGNRMALKTRVLLTDVLGLVTLLGAASALLPMWSSRYTSAFPRGWALLVVLGALLIGGLIGCVFMSPFGFLLGLKTGTVISMSGMLLGSMATYKLQEIEPQKRLSRLMKQRD